MSKIDKLAIQGIRSFGPDEAKRIQFFTPLTLILGQNGCGKTTIIETLKYITTGEVPPGCGKGAAFVHDPKIAGETTVRGQIKLLFNNTKGQQVIGTRSLEVTQNAKKLECKTLDATLKYKGVDGQDTAVSSKCIDFQVEMTSLLGVSKPILENVIFCHQEEANWPLDEGKKVKDRFDAIFNATKYIKCLETIKKIRKDKNNKISNMNQILEALKVSKEQAVSFKKDLEKNERERRSFKDEQDKLQDQKNIVNKRLKEVQEIINSIATVSAVLESKRGQLSFIRESQNELKSFQTEHFPYSDYQLEQMINDFECSSNEQFEKKSNLQENFKQFERSIEQKKREESQMLQSIGSYEAAHRDYISRIKKRDTLLKHLVSKYKILGYEEKLKFSSDEAEELLLKIRYLVNEEDSKLNYQKQEYDVKEKEIQEKLEKLRAKEATLEHDIKIYSEKSQQLSMEIQRKKLYLSKNENALASLNFDNLKESLNQISFKIEEEERMLNVLEIEGNIEKYKMEETSIEKEHIKISDKLLVLNKHAGQQSQLKIYLRDKDVWEKKIQALNNKNAEDFQTIFRKQVGPSAKNELEAKMENIRHQISDKRDQASKLNKQKTEIEITISNNKNLIDKKELDIKKIEDKVREACYGNDFDQTLEKSKEQRATLAKTKGDCESSLVMFKGFLNKLKDGDPCPLCHRDFTEEFLVEMLVEEIESKLKTLPQRLKQTNADLRSHEEIHERLLQLQPLKENADKFQQEIETIKVANIDLHNKLHVVKTDLENISTVCDFLSDEESCANRIHSDIIALDGYFKDLKLVIDKINSLKGVLGDSGETDSMEDAVKLQKELDQKRKQIHGIIAEESKKLIDHTSKLEKLGRQKNDIMTKEMELRTKLHETQKLQENVERLEAEKKEHFEISESNKLLLAPIKCDIRDEINRKSLLIKEKESTLDKINKNKNQILEENRTIEEIHKVIKRYIENGEEQKLMESKKKVESLGRDLKSLDEKKYIIQEGINKIDKEINNQKERKRNLEDEKKIREKEIEINLLLDSIRDLEIKKDKYDIDTTSNEMQDLLIKNEKILQSLAKYDGKLDELLKNKNNILVNLNKKGIKDAEKNYREMFIQSLCLKMACNDLNKYYKALETAIMKFHAEKMAIINSIIRELWKATYRGNDIDFVEIKTDEGESLGSDRRRTFNYRVVMQKNDIEMDMRGRCSAGQKVLASLIIRMALAETFSSKCGILALDEPTTNLDRVNIESLSLALLTIVNRRAAQKNFQLIIITHDDEFLQRLTRADFIEHYYEVSRDGNGFSKITKKDVLHC